MTDVGNSTSASPPASNAGSSGYGRVATRGMVWVATQTILAKGLSFAAQLVLGWLLSKDDYALYAIAISVSSVVSTLRNGGLQKVLIQRGHDYPTLAWPVLQVGLAFNLVCAGLLLGVAPFAVRFYEAPGLPPLLYVIAGAIVLSTPAMVFQARALSELRFGRSAQITSVSAALQYGSMIVFAAFGLGPMSFVLPLVVVAVFESIAFGVFAGFLPPWRVAGKQLLGELMSASGWMMVCALAITVINQGDFLVVGRLQKPILADYFFGVMLAVAIASVFGAGLNSVLMPTLSKLVHEPERFSRAYLQSIRTFVLICAPICVLTAAASGPLVHVLWQGKWDQTIIVVQLFTLSLLFRMLTPIALAAMEARAQWRLSATMLTIDALGTLLAATIGCLAGGILAVSLCVCINRMLMAVFQCVVVGRVNTARATAVLLALTPPLVLCVLAGVVGMLVAWSAGLLATTPSIWLYEAVFCVAFGSSFYAMSAKWVPRRHAEAVEIVRSIIVR